VTAQIKIPKADWVTASPDALWVSTETGRIVRVDPVRRTNTPRLRVGANPLGSAWIGGELWVPNIDDGTVSVVDPSRNAVRATLGAGKGPLAIVGAAGDAWISNSVDGTVWRVRAA
jgi:YVTN family beta-propeller protein